VKKFARLPPGHAIAPTGCPRHPGGLCDDVVGEAGQLVICGVHIVDE